jgi:tRNA nucleotidyltransferase (CCA-adding enzyme)
LRRPERFRDALLACECDARGRLGLSEAPYPQRARLEEALSLAQRVDAAAVVAAAQARGASGAALADALRAARVQAITTGLPAGAGTASDATGDMAGDTTRG